MRRFIDLGDDLNLMLDAAGLGAWRWDPVTNRVEWTRMTEQLFGLEHGTFEGTFEAFSSSIHPDDVDEVVRLIDRMSATGGDFSVQHRVVLSDGIVRWIEGQGRIVLGPEGTPVSGLGIVYDVTDRMNIEQERNQVRLLQQEVRDVSAARQTEVEFLVEASDVLSSSLNVDLVARRLASLLTPQVADGCVVDVRLEEPYGSLLTVALTAGAERPIVSSSPVRKGLGAAQRLGMGLTQAPQLGGEQLGAVLDGSGLDSGAERDDVVWLLEPLRARGTRIGTVVAWRRARSWDAAGTKLLSALCRRGAIALDAAELYRERSAVAAEFSRTTTPPMIPEIPGWNIGAHFKPATELVHLSGDFYDVFELFDGSWMLVVGDACGKGIGAAGQAGSARAVLRAAGQISVAPEDALAVLNRVLMLEPGRPMLTAVVARIAPTEDGATVQIACAGHPAPVVISADGSWREVEVTGTMLGFTNQPAFTPVSLDLADGDALVLYTDGLTETRLGDEFFRLERLAKSLVEAAGVSAVAMAEAGAMSAGVWDTGTDSDDVALLVAMRGR